jgi:tripartite ATP-independent transporter DctP family solute receptor
VKAPLQNRRRVLAALAGGSTGLEFSLPARAAQWQFKCGSPGMPDHPESVRSVQMWAQIERETGGRLRVQYFPSSQLGGDPAMISQVRLGATEMALVNTGTLSTLVPSCDIFNICFVFNDAEEALRTMDGPLGDYVRREAALKGLHCGAEAIDSGMYHVAGNPHPIRTVEDLRGYKLRTINSKIVFDLFKLLGANPVALATNETYTALQTKIIDGEMAPLASIATQRWAEVNKYVSLTNHAWAGVWLIVNKDVWDRLPADVQDVVTRNHHKYMLLERKDVAQINASVAEKFTRQGIVINNVDQRPFRARLGGYFQTWAGEFGPTEWGLLETAVKRKIT